MESPTPKAGDLIVGSVCRVSRYHRRHSLPDYKRQNPGGIWLFVGVVEGMAEFRCLIDGARHNEGQYVALPEDATPYEPLPHAQAMKLLADMSLAIPTKEVPRG